MQRSTEGSPAYSERRASAWQYWQAIWDDPAWITWPKRIGWRGALGPSTSGLGLPGWEGGGAGRRGERVSWCPPAARGVTGKRGARGPSPPARSPPPPPC